MNKTEKIHFGVYGIYEKDGSILMIKKNRGPYVGTYDLPGGKVEFSESIDHALRREIKEETNADVKKAIFLTNEEYQCKYVKGDEERDFHHFGVYYVVDITVDEVQSGYDGHDSDGAIFVPIDKISPETVSPIAYKALRKFLEKIL
jgi:8-oxo-dGTP diphosphatase